MEAQTDSISYLHVDHAKLDSDHFIESNRFERRKFHSQIQGRVQKIELNKYRALRSYENQNNRNEVSLTGGQIRR